MADAVWLCESFSDSFEAAVTLDNQIRECAEIANGQCYLHRSCHPLKEVIIAIAIVRQKELGKNNCLSFRNDQANVMGRVALNHCRCFTKA
ncbi:MAG: hypothetical protein AAF551_13635 [Bacteroidota bacterium]